MKLQRNTTTKIAYILDNWIPPAIRDSKWFMWCAFHLLFKDKAHYFYTFKDKAFSMSHEEFSNVYETLSGVHIERETDLNHACIDKILANLIGDEVLEVGCGRGYLSGKMAALKPVSACDMYISPTVKTRYANVHFTAANIESLPYQDKQFDTVVCTHTLEHVINIQKAISELRRVTKKRLIIVVPKQRPYRYSFDLHIHFFPYKWSLEAFLGGTSAGTQLIELEGDWYYQEEHLL